MLSTGVPVDLTLVSATEVRMLVFPPKTTETELTLTITIANSSLPLHILPTPTLLSVSPSSVMTTPTVFLRLSHVYPFLPYTCTLEGSSHRETVVATVLKEGTIECGFASVIEGELEISLSCYEHVLASTTLAGMLDVPYRLNQALVTTDPVNVTLIGAFEDRGLETEQVLVVFE